METMKKTYVRPEEMVVELKMEKPLLAGSGGSDEDDLAPRYDPDMM